MYDESQVSLKNFYEDICRFTTSFFLAMIYGVRAPRSSTYEAQAFTKVQLDFMYVLEMGKMPPVDLFPILNWLPERFASWKLKVYDVKRRQEELFSRLLTKVKERVDAHNMNGAFMEEAYLMRHEWGLTEPMLL